MPATQAHYRHALGGGEYLDAYSIDPNVGESELKKCVRDSLLTTKGKSSVDLEALSRDIQNIGVYQDFSELQFQPSFDKYQMPEQLHGHRDAIPLGSVIL